MPIYNLNNRLPLFPFDKMIVLPRNLYANMTRSRRGRSYERLDGEGRRTSKKTMKISRLGGPKQGFWRAKAIPRLRRFRVLALSSPLKLLSKLKNSYMNMMLRLAGNVGELNDGNVFGGKRIPKARQIKCSSSAAEAEAKLIFEIYKSLVASGEFKFHVN